ncbi:putative RNA recognition motif domain, CID domain, SWAP/Surp superfamily [Plasmopara halstedii]
MERRQSRRSKEDAGPPQTNLPWGIDNSEMQPSSLMSLTDDKLARFALGHQKKTKFQKEREDREAKKRQADEEAARIYATFVASFDNEDEIKGKAFVRSGAHADKGDTRTRGAEYRLQGKKEAVPFVLERNVSEMDKMLHEIKQKDAEQMKRRDEAQVINRPKKRRAIDDFLEEMKERGPVSVSVEGLGMSKGSFDTGDPETTNLYVGNLAPTITEEVLKAEFERYGEVCSVKIMWPRSEEERARRRNCGFVSFYERRDADEARVNLDNKQLEGQPMIVGWGKAVKVPSRPRNLVSSKILENSVLPPRTTSNVSNLFVKSAEVPIIKIEMPTDQEVKWRVDRLARYVASDGLQFENIVRMREANNEVYKFLFKPDSAIGLYYRWRVYSFAMGDDEHSWRSKPFQMTLDGPVWYPPKTSSTSFRQEFLSTSPKRSSRQRRSRSYSRSRSRSICPNPERLSRKSRSRGRYRSRSSSASPDDRKMGRRSRRRPRKCRGRSRSRNRRSRSCSSDISESKRRYCRPRFRSRKNDQWRQKNDCDISEERRRSDAQREDRQEYVENEEQLLTGQQIARARNMKRGRERCRLSNQDYDSFKNLLEKLTLERESVKKAMGFALDNSEAAVDLVYIIFDSFKESTSSGLMLVGLLYVTSDILYNSSAAVKNASLFRTTFQECLPEIMDILRMAHKNILGRMSANAMKERVTNVLTAWENWSLFPPAVLVGLHATFLRREEEDDYIAARNLRFDDITDSEIERLRKTCRQSGIVATGGVKQLLARLQWLKEFTSPTTQASSKTTIAADNQVCTDVTVNQAGLKSDSSNAVSIDLSESSKEKKEDTFLVKTLLDKDLDGEPIEEENDTVGSFVDEGVLGDEALDGEPLDGRDSAEGDFDGESLKSDDLDGPFDKEEMNGKPF